MSKDIPQMLADPELLLDLSRKCGSYTDNPRVTRDIDKLVDNSPVGLLYPDCFYDESHFWQTVRDSGVVNVNFNDALGDSILSFSLINHLKRTREIIGIPFQINLASKYQGLLRAYYDYDPTIGSHTKHGFSYDEPLIMLGKNIARTTNTYHIPLVPHTTHPVMPYNPDRSLRTVSELIYRALELTTGVKTQHNLANLDYTLPLPPLTLEEMQLLYENMQSLHDAERYIVVGNMASHRTKCFGDEQFRDIIAGIQTLHADIPVVYIRDPHDNDIETQDLLRQYSSQTGRQVQFVKEDLALLANIMNGAALALFPDTGMAHLAAALRIPTVLGFTAAYPYFWKYPEGTYIPVATAHALSLKAAKLDKHAWKAAKDPTLRGSREFTYINNANQEEGLVTLGSERFVMEASSILQ